MGRTISRYGWVRDLPDFRDHKFSDVLGVQSLSDLPSLVDLRNEMPPVYDQGSLGSCTANAIGAAVQYDLRKLNLPDFMPSRLFIYFNEREMEGTIKVDSGAMIRDGMKSLSVQGVCHETIMPYVIERFTRRPTKRAYTDGLRHNKVQYMSVEQSESGLKSALASGFPVVFGFAVYNSFEGKEVAASGIVEMPKPNETCIGGHAVLIVGYDDSTRRFIVRNSWGESWGMRGYFTMPYDYVLNSNLADDFWVLKSIN